MEIPKKLIPLWTRLKSASKLPGFSLVVLIVISLAVEESYPFSAFPMYSGPGKSQHLLYLADGEGNPVPITKYTGQRTSWLKKLYYARLDKIGDAKNMRSYKLPPEDQAIAAIETLDYLRQAARERGKKGEGLPDKLRLVRLSLRFQDMGGAPSRTERILGEN